MQHESPVSMSFDKSDRGPAATIPGHPALATVLNFLCNRTDSRFLTTLEHAVHSVLGGEVPEYGVSSDEMAADVNPEHVEFTISDNPMTGPLYQDRVGTRDCAIVISRWREFLATCEQSGAA